MKEKSENFISFLKSMNENKDKFPLHEPFFYGNEKKYILETIDSTYISSFGTMINNLENKISKYTKINFSIACINGTSALHAALLIAGVKKGDEIITQSLSFVATSNAISYTGGVPVYVDVDIDTMGMSPTALQDFLEEHCEIREEGTFNVKTRKKIGACVPMHTFGFMCRIDKIKKICKKWNIPLIEDAAEAFGSSYKGLSAGKYGMLSIFSFNGNKIITSGGGGCIVTEKKSFFKKAKHITSTAKISSNWEFNHDQVGYNYRMPNLNAAIALGQLEQINQKIQYKKTLYEHYKENLPNMGIELVQIPENTSWNYWLMAIKLSSKKERDKFLAFTNNKKVFTRPIWKLLYKLPMYRYAQRDSQKNSIFLEKTIVNIPSNILLNEKN